MKLISGHRLQRANGYPAISRKFFLWSATQLASIFCRWINDLHYLPELRGAIDLLSPRVLFLSFFRSHLIPVIGMWSTSCFKITDRLVSLAMFISRACETHPVITLKEHHFLYEVPFGLRHIIHLSHFDKVGKTDFFKSRLTWVL